MASFSFLIHEVSSSSPEHGKLSTMWQTVPPVASTLQKKHIPLAMLQRNREKLTKDINIMCTTQVSEGYNIDVEISDMRVSKEF